MKKGRVVRVALAAALAGVVVWTLAPHAMNRVSTSAVVNAPLMRVVSPLEGRIADRAPQVGEAVGPGDTLVTIVRERRSEGRLADLEAKVRSLAGKREALSGLRSELLAARSDLAERLARYRERAQERLAVRVERLEAQVKGALAERTRAAQALSRARTLRSRGVASEARVEELAAGHAAAEARLAELKARSREAEVQAAAGREGVYLGDGYNDVPYTRQRLDEIRLRLADLARDRRTIEREIAGLEERVRSERARVARRDAFRPSAAGQGVIWSAAGGAGDPVVPGQAVVDVADCTRRFVEVAVSERYFEDISPGDAVRVHLKGSDGALQARVAAVRGAGARQRGEGRFAADLTSVERGQLRVLVSLEQAGLDRPAERFCHIGRTAEVYFPRASGELVEQASRGLASWLRSVVGPVIDGASRPGEADAIADRRAGRDLPH